MAKKQSKAKVEPKVLTEAEMFYVTEKSKDGMTPDEIAAVLKLSVDDIVPYLHKKAKGPTQTYKAFTTKTGTGKDGVTIMTPAASQIGDVKVVNPNRDMSRFITRTKAE